MYQQRVPAIERTKTVRRALARVFDALENNDARRVFERCHTLTRMEPCIVNAILAPEYTLLNEVTQSEAARTISSDSCFVISLYARPVPTSSVVRGLFLDSYSLDIQMHCAHINPQLWRLLCITGRCSDYHLALRACAVDPQAIEYAPSSIMSEELVLTALRCEGVARNICRLHYFKKKDFILRALLIQPGITFHIDDHLKGDRDFALKMVETSGIALGWLPRYFSDEQFVLLSAKSYPFAPFLDPATVRQMRSDSPIVNCVILYFARSARSENLRRYYKHVRRAFVILRAVLVNDNTLTLKLVRVLFHNAYRHSGYHIVVLRVFLNTINDIVCNDRQLALVTQNAIYGANANIDAPADIEWPRLKGFLHATLVRHITCVAAASLIELVDICANYYVRHQARDNSTRAPVAHALS